MKNKVFLLIVLAYFLSSKCFAQNRFSLHTGYVGYFPQETMRNTLKSSHGLGVGLQYNLCKHPISFGVDFGITTYGSKSKPIVFQFDSLSPITHTDIRISNSMFTIIPNAKVRIYDKKGFTVYAGIGLGATIYSTDMYIEDPEEGGCKPLDNKLLHNDATITARVLSGVQIDVSKVFKRAESGKFLFDINIQYLKGGNVEYVGKLYDDFADAHYNHNTTYNTENGIIRSYDAQFINTENNIVHEHPVGELYKNNLNAIGLSIGIVFNFGKNCP